MRKMIFLALTFLVFSAASVNAQVTIGSSDDPHPSALLDLQSNTQGLLLPQVALSGSTDFLIAGGDKTIAQGMLVYNTSNNLDGPGLYVWTGSIWKSLNTNCTPPATPGIISFSPASTSNIIENTLFTAFVNVVEGATSYIWNLPDGLEIVGDANGRSISIRAISTGDYDAADITVKATNDCGSSDPRAGSGTIKVNACTAAPVAPTLAMSNNYKMSVGETVTLRCSDVGATSYNWILPEGLTAPSTTTTADSIIVTGAVEGIYYFYDIKVSATNSCGTSVDREGTYGTIIVETCDKAPSDPITKELEIMRTPGGRFTVSLSVVSKGATTYEWSVPAGLSIVSGNNTYVVTIECTTVGNYKGSDIKVKVSNACGSLTTAASGTIRVVQRGSKGTDLIGEEGIYTTFRYPAGLGTWMTANSKEGTPTKKAANGHAEGERGYYYSAEDALSACPAGWQLPSPIQYADLWSYLSSITTSAAEIEPWLNVDAAAGYVNSSTGASTNWGTYLYLHTNVPTRRYYAINLPTVAYTSGTPAANISFSVRCVKSTCDEAPVIASLSGLSRTIPKDVPVKVFANAGSLVNTSYQWSTPAGTTVEAGVTPDTLYITFHSEGNFSGNDLSVTVTNNCGSTSAHYTGTYAVTDTGTPGPPLVTNNNSYRTYIFPGNLGTWMCDWSKEGSPEGTTYPGKQAGERGYYYSYSEMEEGCPSGWRIPNRKEIWNLFAFLRSMPEDNEYRQSWLSDEALQGYYSVAGTWIAWNTSAGIRLNNGNYVWYSANSGNPDLELFYISMERIGVRCIKDEN